MDAVQPFNRRKLIHDIRGTVNVHDLPFSHSITQQCNLWICRAIWSNVAMDILHSCHIVGMEILRITCVNLVVPSQTFGKRKETNRAEFLYMKEIKTKKHYRATRIRQ